MKEPWFPLKLRKWFREGRIEYLLRKLARNYEESTEVAEAMIDLTAKKISGQ